MENLAFETVRQTIERYLQNKDELIKLGKDVHDFNNYPLYEIVLPNRLSD